MAVITDRGWMTAALQLAEQGRSTTHPNPNVGCVIVKDDQIIGCGWHRAAPELLTRAKPMVVTQSDGGVSAVSAVNVLLRLKPPA